MVQHKLMTALLERNDLVQVEGFIQKIKMIKVEAAKKKKKMMLKRSWVNMVKRHDDFRQ